MKYETPNMEIIYLEQEDVIITSDTAPQNLVYSQDVDELFKLN